MKEQIINRFLTAQIGIIVLAGILATVAIVRHQHIMSETDALLARTAKYVAECK